jgi:hypothetical protein
MLNCNITEFVHDTMQFILLPVSFVGEAKNLTLHNYLSS